MLIFRRYAFLTGTASSVVLGALAALLGASGLASWIWAAGALMGIAASIAWTAAAAMHRQATVDVIALLAMAGALLVSEPLAAAVIAAMLATGRALEQRSRARAERALRQLVARQPVQARRKIGKDIEIVAVASVVPGDELIVASGEVVPVDGRLVLPAEFDESALTGEPMPVRRQPGQTARSGSVNVGNSAEIVALSTSADSEYSAIVRLVDQAQAQSAPYVRLADRVAWIFLPIVIAVAGISWAATGDLTRAVAVLVVATPCPLILAVPIAVICGMSQCSKSGVIVKGGAALEALAQVEIALFDKTGTLTAGRPELIAIEPASVGFRPDDILRYAASLDQASPHVVATAIVTAARARGLDLLEPSGVSEPSGFGAVGCVEGTAIALGSLQTLQHPRPDWAMRVQEEAARQSRLAVFVSVDSFLAGALLFSDPLRPDAADAVAALRRAGIGRTVLVSGDRREVAEAVGRAVGMDAVVSECTPSDKVRVVADESRRGPCLMVGDGINDAPALAAAHVGVALAGNGSTASSEAAGIVLVSDRLEALSHAVLIAKRSRSIAKLSAATGLALSLAAMGLAAAGFLAPVAGAFLQEGIDVLAIAIALTAALPVSAVGKQG